ncbi:hypothetical protein [Gelidibacter salicanalis]|uniref:Uncharacterized protein n=1 Tax=Gelidibacter salicanalis TaxID=291193 RepID=A0A934KSA2_9FLAO|nr:hypothetical protein [Gelidibacter salicanalis]MBJ7879188.1 hypothetical protein [Gelidibacter salicanalis]
MNTEHHKEVISRKEAMQRMGKYAALTAVGTFLILNPKTAQAQSIGSNRVQNSSANKGNKDQGFTSNTGNGNKGNGKGNGYGHNKGQGYNSSEIWN